MSGMKTLKKQLWAVYNHLPGGHVCAIHFEDFERQKKDGDRTVTVLITAKDQVEGFKKTPQVALNIKGKTVAREVLVYDGPDVQGKPEAADIVLAWAYAKGVEPIQSPAEAAKAAQTPQSIQKIEALEKDVAGLKEGMTGLGSKLDQILAALPKQV